MHTHRLITSFSAVLERRAVKTSDEGDSCSVSARTSSAQRTGNVDLIVLWKLALALPDLGESTLLLGQK
jgi:hypothetical protein